MLACHRQAGSSIPCLRSQTVYDIVGKQHDCHSTNQQMPASMHLCLMCAAALLQAEKLMKKNKLQNTYAPALRLCSSCLANCLLADTCLAMY